MKVLWAHNFDPGVPNAGTFMHTLKRGVADLGVSVEMLYLGNLRRPSDALRSLLALRELARTVDLVHAQFGSMCALISAAAPGKKVLSLRGSDWYALEGDVPPKDRMHSYIATRVTRAVLRRFDSIVVMSERMRRDLGPNAGRIRVVVIPDGIDLDAFRPMDRKWAKEQLGFASDLNPWVLFPTVQSNNPIKRPNLAVRAIDFARRTIPDLQLRVATGVPHQMMPVLMNAASVVLMTSVHEGWPNSIKEALACNTPFVSTDVSDLSEIARLEPSCSVAPADPELLGAALVRAVQCPRSETLRSRIDWMDVRRAAQQLVSEYEVLLADGIDSAL